MWIRALGLAVYAIPMCSQSLQSGGEHAALGAALLVGGLAVSFIGMFEFKLNRPTITSLNLR